MAFGTDPVGLPPLSDRTGYRSRGMSHVTSSPAGHRETGPAEVETAAYDAGREIAGAP